jgi:hypothetical protein
MIQVEKMVTRSGRGDELDQASGNRSEGTGEKSDEDEGHSWTDGG